MAEEQSSAPLGNFPSTRTDASGSDRPHVIWPKVLGIVMIILGCLSIPIGISSVYYNYGYRIYEARAKLGVGKPLTPDQLEFLREPLIHDWNLISTAGLGLFVILAVVLLVSGIGMVRRRRWSVGVAKAWASIKIVVGLAMVAIGWIVKDRIAAAVASGNIQAETVPQDLMRVSAGGMTSQAVMLVALPVFVLIWLSLRSTKEEAVYWN